MAVQKLQMAESAGTVQARAWCLSRLERRGGTGQREELGEGCGHDGCGEVA